MQKSLAILLTLSFFFILQSNQKANAQAAYRSQAQTGVYGRSTYRTNNYRRSNAQRTRQQRTNLIRTTRRRLAHINGPRGRNGLPPTRLDSFVKQAREHADHIYGGEGRTLPKYFEFGKIHRINNGIRGRRDRGLTTGHGSYMPDAWGGDEFVDGPEFTYSGANYGNPMHYSQGRYIGAEPDPALLSEPR